MEGIAAPPVDAFDARRSLFGWVARFAPRRALPRWKERWASSRGLLLRSVGPFRSVARCAATPGPTHDKTTTTRRSPHTSTKGNRPRRLDRSGATSRS